MNLVADQQLIRDAEKAAGGAHIHWVRNRTLTYDVSAAFYNKGIKKEQYKEIFLINEEQLKKFVATGLRD